MNVSKVAAICPSTREPACPPIALGPPPLHTRGTDALPQLVHSIPRWCDNWLKSVVVVVRRWNVLVGLAKLGQQNRPSVPAVHVFL